jgi:hypothetical protein
VKWATVSADGETITVHIPLTFRKRGGRKLVVTPDGAEWAPRPRVDNAMVKALARAFRRREMLDSGSACDPGRSGQSQGNHAVICKHCASVDAARAGYRRGASGGAAGGVAQPDNDARIARSGLNSHRVSLARAMMSCGTARVPK